MMTQPNAGGPGIGTDDCDRLLFEIVDEIAAALEVEPFELAPLEDAVDVDAIVRLVASASPTTPERLTISFRYEEALVSVFGDGSVEVSSLGATNASTAGAVDA